MKTGTRQPSPKDRTKDNTQDNTPARLLRRPCNKRNCVHHTYRDGSLGVLAVGEDHVQQVVRQLVEVLQREDLEHQHVLRALVVADVADHAHH